MGSARRFWWALHRRIENEVVGMKTSTGLQVSGQADGFLQGVVGAAVDPDAVQYWGQVTPQSGMNIEAIIKTLRNGNARSVTKVDGRRVQTFQGEACDVVVDVDTGELVGCCPSKVVEQ